MKKDRIVVRLLPAVIAGLFSGTAGAAGFQLLEQNASGIGNAFAGTAAVAEDASTVFFNPAGMAFLPGNKRQFAVSLDAVKPTAKFSDNGTVAACAVPTPTGACVVRNSLGGNGGDAGDWAAIPAAYVTLPINDRLMFGLGIGAPFGLATEYDDGWAGRYHALKSEVKTININPSLSYRVNDNVALGFGLNYQRFEAELTSAVNYSLVLTSATGAAAPANLDGKSRVSGEDDGWGWNIGALFQVSPSTRVGVAYRSAIKYNVTGDVSFSAPAAVPGAVVGIATPNGPVKLDVKLPDVFTVSVSQKLTDKWEMLGDLSWTGWAKIKSLDIYRSSGALLSRLDEQWRNTYRISFGANYRYSDKWKIRMGIAYDQTPVKDELRHPSLPDSDRTWLTVGAQYQLNPNARVDFGYAHLFIKDGSILDNGGSPQPTNSLVRGVLTGNYSNSTDILGVQYSQSF